jgi:hypothetical protein
MPSGKRSGPCSQNEGNLPTAGDRLPKYRKVLQGPAVSLGFAIDLGERSRTLRRTIRDLPDTGRTEIILNFCQVNSKGSAGIGEPAGAYVPVKSMGDGVFQDWLPCQCCLLLSKGFLNVDLDALIFGGSEVDHQESYVVLLPVSPRMF